MTLRANDLISLDTNVLVHWIRQNDTGIQLRKTYKAGGHNTGQNDMWIAATTKAAGAVLLTCDVDCLWMNHSDEGAILFQRLISMFEYLDY